MDSEFEVFRLLRRPLGQDDRELVRTMYLQTLSLSTARQPGWRPEHCTIRALTISCAGLGRGCEMSAVRLKELGELFKVQY
jgi:hypothetical protein